MKLRFVKIVFASVLVHSVATAQDATTVSSAREAARQGLDALDAGRYEEARDKLLSAYQVVPVPTIALFAARAQDKLGNWVEAAELYMSAMRQEVKGGEVEVQREAQKTAETERSALLPRIPRLYLKVVGVPAAEVTVEINGRPVPNALFATGWLVNPVETRLVATTGAQKQEHLMKFVEGKAETVTLQFEPSSNKPTTGATPLSPNVTNVQFDSGREPSLQRTAGWITLGVGSAALLFGGVTGAVALKKKSTLDDDGCSDNQCERTLASQMESYNTLRNLSTYGFIGGAVFAAAGGALLLTAPGPKPTRTLAAYVGVGTAGVIGQF